MTNKLVVIINSLRVPKIKKILLYEMKFLVPNCSCLQNPWLTGLPPPDPRSVCPLSSTEFVEPPPPRTKFLGTPLSCTKPDDGLPIGRKICVMQWSTAFPNSVSHLQNLGARKMTCSKFNNEDPQSSSDLCVILAVVWCFLLCCELITFVNAMSKLQ